MLLRTRRHTLPALLALPDPRPSFAPPRSCPRRATHDGFDKKPAQIRERRLSVVEPSPPRPTSGFESRIGNTPIVRVKSLAIPQCVEVLGKLECTNPGGSIKDRTALGLIRDAEASGRLRPGYRVVESSSGNLGVALAMLCSSMSSSLPPARAAT